MLKPHPACRESMDLARLTRILHRGYCGGGAICSAAEDIAGYRMTARETVRALRAARRSEGALLARWGVA